MNLTLRNLKRNLIIILIAFLMSTLLPSIASTNELYAQNITKLESAKIIKDPKKPWTISFNKEVNPLTATTNNLYIEDSHGTILSLTPKILENNTTIVVEPSSSYKVGESYYLCIKNKVQSVSGQYLTDDIRMPFTYEHNETELPTSKPEKFDMKLSYSAPINERTSSFPRWRNTVTSHLTNNNDGTMNLVEFNSEKKSIIIETYDQKYNLIGSKSIKAELPIFGGYYSGETYNYIAFGQLNLEENNNKEVIRIVKYDKNFKRVGSVSLNGGQCYTTTPFDAGSGRMAENGDTLVFHTSRERYATKDGARHQSQLTIIVDTSKMKVKNYTGEFQTNHVSHSFDQYVLFDGNNHVLLDHGDAYPRSIVLSKETGGNYTDAHMFEIPGAIGANCTGVSIGGFEMSSDKYIVAMNTIDHSLVSQYTSYEMVGLDIDQRDIILRTVPRNNLNSKPEQITLGKYVGTNKIASIPQMVKLSDDNLIVLWQEYILNKDTSTKSPGDLKYVFIDKNGKPKGDISTVSNFRLSDCKPIIFDNKIIWYTNSVEYGEKDEFNRTFYSIPLKSSM